MHHDEIFVLKYFLKILTKLILKYALYDMSTFVTPDKVVSPRKYWSLIRVLETGNQPDSHGERVAVAIGNWKNWTTSEESKVLAMRWNGDEDRPLGTPQSRGLPTWFIVPRRFQDAVIDTLSKDDQQLVKTLLDE